MRLAAKALAACAAVAVIGGGAEAATVSRRGEPEPGALVAVGDPAHFHPPKLEVASDDSPVYPLEKVVPAYPNRLQTDAAGRPVYPDPRPASLLAPAQAPSLVETGSGARLRADPEPLVPEGVPLVTSGDPAHYHPPKLEVASDDSPVYPLEKAVPAYPNRLQTDAAGRPVYPDPRPASLLAPAQAPSLVETGAGAAASDPAPPVYLITPESLGIGGFQNLDPYSNEGKIRTMHDYVLALQRQAVLSFGSSPGLTRTVNNARNNEILKDPAKFVKVLPNGNTLLPDVVLGLLEVEAGASSAEAGIFGGSRGSSGKSGSAAGSRGGSQRSTTSQRSGAPRQQQQQQQRRSGGTQREFFSPEQTAAAAAPSEPADKASGVPTYEVVPFNSPTSFYNNFDPFDPGRPPMDMKRQLHLLRQLELMSNPGFQATPMYLPPPGAYLSFLEAGAAAGPAVFRAADGTCRGCQYLE